MKTSGAALGFLITGKAAALVAAGVAATAAFGADDARIGATGAKPPSAADITKSVVSIPSDFAAKAMPTTFSLREELPRPGNQGKAQSCVAWAIGYGMLIQQYGLKDHPFSSDFLYRYCLLLEKEQPERRQRISGNGENIDVRTAFAVLRKNGNCFAELMTNFRIPPSKRAVSRAADFRTRYYVSTIKPHDHHTIKSDLLARKPLPILCSVDDTFAKQDFQRPNGDIVWERSAGGTGPHVMLLAGWDDTKHAYEVMNSQGSDWGDRGYVWIDYDFFERATQAVYTYRRRSLTMSQLDLCAEATAAAKGETVAYCRLATRDLKTHKVDRGTLAFTVNRREIGTLREGALLKRSEEVPELNVRSEMSVRAPTGLDLAPVLFTLLPGDEFRVEEIRGYDIAQTETHWWIGGRVIKRGKSDLAVKCGP